TAIAVSRALSEASSSGSADSVVEAVAAEASGGEELSACCSLAGADAISANAAFAAGSRLDGGESSRGSGGAAGGAPVASVAAGTLAADEKKPASNTISALMTVPLVGPSGKCERISSAPPSATACSAIEIPVARAVPR